MNKRGLATGLIAIVLIMFLMAIANMMALYGWSQIEDVINNADNTTIAPHVKEQILDLKDKVLFADKLFVFTFVGLLIAYLISAFSIPPDQPVFLLLFAGILLMITIFAMIMSNTWTFILGQSDFSSLSSELTFTNFFMRFYPIFTFVIGLIGAIIFYTRIGGGGNAATSQFE